MGVRVLTDTYESKSVLYDSVTETAFGPVIGPSGNYEAAQGTDVDCETLANGFLMFLQIDARKLSEGELEEQFNKYLVAVKGREFDPERSGSEQ